MWYLPYTNCAAALHTSPAVEDADTYATAVSDVDTTDLGKYSSEMCEWNAYTRTP